MSHKGKKILVLGSGALKIGEAGEFDYSGSQAIKALKEEGCKTILVNPNIATIQTSDYMAERLYSLPVTLEFVEKVIEKERPDGILLAFGGQTALNCGIALADAGVLKKHHVEVLGTPVETIRKTEDRALFAQALHDIGCKTPRSVAVTTVKDALAAAEQLGYPVMARSAFSLGGEGSGVARAAENLRSMITVALRRAPQVLIEEYLGGWKEIEYEVVRDKFDNCVTVCNMENFDPLGIHTGESIVVAPSQTLTNSEYHMLREISIKVIRSLGVIGECNIQFALAPGSEDYRIIEVNARLSRSSALASKATGYPLAFIAAKLALGYSLPNLRNPITKVTTACFEPALDYVVVKIPRWDLNKFKIASHIIGSEMKSVGEVMAIGRTFEEALQKAIRMLQIGMKGLTGNKLTIENVEETIANPTDVRLFAVAEEIRLAIAGKGTHAGYDRPARIAEAVAKINRLSGIDNWFLWKIAGIVNLAADIEHAGKISPEAMLEAKRKGFSDYQLGLTVGKSEKDIREMRKKMGVLPCVKQIDTLAGEFPAKTNYLYMTYNGDQHDVEFDGANSVIVLGSGAYRIGSSVEFDWCSVNAVLTLKQQGYSPTVINYNPETVSTDYDICDRLYFDELSFERVQDIYELEKPHGMIVSMGGQIPNDLVMRSHEAGMKILGTSALSIDSAEDRHKFSKLLDKLHVDQPEWQELTSLDEVKIFARKVGYPVLVRPSYVLSGAAMNVVWNEQTLEKYLVAASDVSPEHPIVVTKFLTRAKEIEIDAVAGDGKLIAWAISEHVENAGVHSGDATLILPPQKTYLATVRRIKQITRQIAEALKITGPFNIQFLAKENEIKVIECNLRASRSFPFVSKVFKINFIDLATRAMLGLPVPQIPASSLELDYVGVKASQFSFSRLKGADPVTGVEMASTGEVGCLGDDLYDAFLKALISTGFKLPRKSILLSITGDENRWAVLDAVRQMMEMGFEMYATDHTHQFFAMQGIKTELLHKMHEKHEPNVATYLTEGKIDMLISMPGLTGSDYGDSYQIRRMAVDFAVPLINNAQMVKLFSFAIAKKKMENLEVKAWQDY